MKSDEGDWQNFELWVEQLRASVGQKGVSRLIFRGQSNYEWPLETTLERIGHKNMFLADYYKLITKIGPAVSAFTALQTPTYDPILEKQFCDTESFFEPDRYPSGPHYEYMVYLRHHGFPSPLLDWTRSPHVAAFFAFRRPDSKCEKRSIYAYCENLTGCKGGAVGSPMIRILGPYVHAHRRHFLQQSVYTVCESQDVNDNWQYDSHETVFKNSYPGQDYLWKFDIRSTERSKVLHSLDEFNLNSYSLFGSEEALLETLWTRDQVFRNP